MAYRVKTVQHRCEQSGFFPLWVSHVYGESVGQWGVFSGSGDVGCIANECHVDFEYPNVAGVQELFLSWGGTINVYRDCVFRYYGQPQLTMKFTGNSLIDHCKFSGPLVTPDQGPTFINVPK